MSLANKLDLEELKDPGRRLLQEEEESLHT